MQDIQSVWFISPHCANPTAVFFLTNQGVGVWSDTFQISSENSPGSYPFVFTARDSEGNLSDEFVHTVIVKGPPTFVFSGSESKPARFQLFQNFPNPFNSSTTILFGVSTRSLVSLKVVDMLGREISTIVLGELPAGTYTRQWNAANTASGVYLYRLKAGTYSETKKLLILR